MNCQDCWPDGGPYLEQENIVVQMFTIFKKVRHDLNQEKVKNGSGRN